MTRVQWQSEQLRSTDQCELIVIPGGRRLAGLVLAADEGRPVQVTYQVDVDDEWRTRTATVILLREGHDPQALTLSADEERHWEIDGMPEPTLDGCTDVDLEWTPATNTLPIRRLGLAVGEAAALDAAWVRFPSFRVERLPQRYERLAERRWRYSSGTFEAELEVDEDGVVLDYANAWRAVAHSRPELLEASREPPGATRLEPRAGS